MAVNIKIGSINPIGEIGKIIKKYNKNILFHVDGVQSFTKIDVDLSNVDLYSVSGHKIHAPKGVGFLLCQNEENFSDDNWRGQQNNLRSGAVNMPSIVAMNKAFEIRMKNFKSNSLIVQEVKKYFISKITQINDIKINSPLEFSSDYICSVTIKGVSAEILLRGS